MTHSINRRWLVPLTPVYATAVAIKNAAYDRRWMSAHALTDPVISVGNISTGGTGKTPFVIYLARKLADTGLAPDVLSRGYGRAAFAQTGRPAERVDPAGTATRYGDEPLLIARSTGVPVYVGAQRFDAGLLAESDAGDQERVHLLDDGFQHRQLARTVDIVLLHADDFADHLLPVGNLREPMQSIARARITVLRCEHRNFAARVIQITGRSPWIVRRTMQVDLEGKRPLAFCGLARPQEFFCGLHELGITTTAEIAFADHHRYTSADIRRLLDAAKQNGADSLVTTEKDAVKLPSPMIERLQQSGKLAIARLALSLEDEARSMAELIALLA